MSGLTLSLISGRTVCLIRQLALAGFAAFEETESPEAVRRETLSPDDNALPIIEE